MTHRTRGKPRPPASGPGRAILRLRTSHGLRHVTVACDHARVVIDEAGELLPECTTRELVAIARRDHAADSGSCSCLELFA